MPKNQPNKRGCGKSANKNAPAAQKPKTTMGAATESAKGDLPSLALTEGGTPTGADESVGQYASPPSTTTSEEQIVQADQMGDQPSTGKQNGGGETVEEIIPSEQGGSKEGDQPTTDDQKIGGESVGVNISTEQGGEVGVAQGVSSDQGGSKEVTSESSPPPPTTTDANDESIVAATLESTKAIPTTETTVGSLQPSDETNAPSDETNAPSPVATATTAVQSTTKKVHKKSSSRPFMPPNQLKKHYLGPNALNVGRRCH